MSSSGQAGPAGTTEEGLAASIQQLGRKARKRSAEEQSKRPEIVRINDFPPQTQMGGDKKMIREPPGTSSVKRRRVSSQPRRAVLDQSVDRWMPDITHIRTCANPKMQSCIVRLHGLPVRTSPGHIRRFFCGLNVERIMILPSLPSHLPAWDANHNVSRKKGACVDRYPPEFRVLVKFNAAPTAAVAVDRSGEVIPVAQSMHADKQAIGKSDDSKDDLGDSGDAPTGASVAVTQLLEFDTSCFIHHGFFIDAEAGVALDVTLKKVEGALDPLVKQILWTCAARKLNLKHDNTHGSQFIPYPLYACKSTTTTHPIERETIAAHRDKLAKERDRLCSQCPFPATEAWDPGLLEIDPILRLTTAATDCLNEEIERLDDALLRLRHLDLCRMPTYRTPFINLKEKQAGNSSK